MEIMKNIRKNEILKILLLSVQTVAIITVGIAVKDVWYKIIISLLGLGFNFFTSNGKRFGFLFGCAYALTYSAMAFSERIYASAVFMLFIQLPVALYSFISWKKSQSKGEVKLKKLTVKQSIVVGILFFISIAGIYFILNAVKSNGPLLDAVFFSITLLSCVLLAFYYRSAYLFVALSGVAGTAVWAYQLIVNNTGASVLTLYVFVLINALSAIKQQYLNKKI